MDGFIALGSNLGDRRENLQAGLRGLGDAGLTPVALSSVWETEPVDCADPRWFWNMAVHVRTAHEPLDVLETLMGIERRAGRRRSLPNAPRSLDLDLLLLDERTLVHERLQLPHPRMWNRRFVLEPLAEIAPELVNPSTGRTVAQERDRLSEGSAVRRLGPLATCCFQPV